ncbi:MAG TPA: PAS domain S-box protein [Vicinamibacterales bacterium]
MGPRDPILFEDLFERAPVAYHELDLEGRITRVNDTELALFGYAREEMLGHHVWEFSADPEEVERVVRARLAGHSRPPAERAFVRKDGGIFWGWVQVREMRDEHGALTGLRAATTDTTELRRAQQALRDSEERHRLLFERIPIGIYETTPGGQFLAVNPSFARLLGYASADEVLAVPDVRRFYARPELRERFETALAKTGWIADFENVLFTRDGRELFVVETAYAVRDEAGEIRAYRGTVSDITERRRLEAQLLQAQKMEAIGRFAGGVAHDFNNLLTVIAGYAEMLAEDLPPDSREGGDLREILSATSRAGSLTRQLLAFSRKQVLQLRVFDVTAALAAMSPMLQRLIGEDVQLVVQPGGEPLNIEADEVQLQQVIFNLATNARDAMPGGGTLTLTTDRVGAVPGFENAPEGPWARLAVADSGCGMDEATRALIFEPFFTTKPADRGTGLGLATSYGIVKQLQGYILVESEVGRGTTFSLYFPVKERPADAPVEAPAHAAHAGHRSAHIFVVEDESAVRELVTAVLMRAGYRVTVASNPAEALRISDEALASVDLLLSDVVMPGLRGPEMVRALRERRPDLRALFMTGYVDPARDSSATVGRFLLKPFQPAHLLERVAEELE